MKIAIVSNNYLRKNKENTASLLNESFNGCEVSFFSCERNDNIIENLKAFAPSFLITEDLAGFNMTTLMDNTAYNKLHTLQFHILTNAFFNTPSNLQALKKPLSLTMHFICTSDKEKEALLSVNLDIPYIHINSGSELIPCDYIRSIISAISHQ